MNIVLKAHKGIFDAPSLGAQTSDLNVLSFLLVCASAALPVRRQQPAGSSAMSQYPRPAPPGRQSQTDQEFDPNILSSMVGFNPLELLGNAPSFAPDAAEPGHKRTHDQMQQMPQVTSS